jgi:hypothetical protein
MTGKPTSPQKNRFIVELNNKYSVVIDRLSLGLLKKGVPDLGDETEVEEEGYITLGYYPPKSPEYLAARLMVEKVVTKVGGKKVTFDEFVNLFNKYMDTLAKEIKTHVNPINQSVALVDDLRHEIKYLKTEISKYKRRLAREI